MKFSGFLISFLYIFLLMPIKAIYAQEEDLFAEVYTVNNGLPSNSITCMHKDSKGYIWIGTLYGLAKYDGNKFTIFKHNVVSNSISGDVVTTMFEDSKGNMLFGAAGLSIYYRKTNRWVNYIPDPNNPDAISDNASSIYQENDSIYWITTYLGLNRFNINNGKFKRIDILNNRWQTTSGILYIEKGEYIILRYNRSYLKYSIKSNTYEEFPIQLIDSYYGNTFFQKNIFSKRLNTFKGWEIERFDLSTSKEYSLKKIKDGKGTLFCNDESLFLVEDQMITKFDKNFKQITSVNFKTEFNSNVKNVIYSCGLIESDGTIWIGSNQGLHKVLPQSPFHVLDSNNGLPIEYVRGLTIDSKNNLWVGVKGGPVFKISNFNSFIDNPKEGFKIVNFPIRAKLTNQIVELKDSNLLCVSHTSLYYLNAKKQKITSEYLYSPVPCWSGVEISNGVLIGTLSEPALSKVVIEGGRIVRDSTVVISNAPKLVHTLYKDNNNQVWLGGEGLYKANFSPDSTRIDIEECIPDKNAANKLFNSVWNILEVDSNRLFVGTTTNGFYIYNKKTKEYQHFSKTEGLPTDHICAVIKDHRNNFWLTTKEGITFVDGSDFSMRNYSVKSGPYATDFNYKCGTKTSNNWILFGSKHGITYFHPDSIKRDTISYPLRINEFRIFDKNAFFELSDSDTININYNQNFFTFEFALQDYRNPAAHQYKYQLLNFDRAVRLTDGQNPRATYTNVPPGKYIFKLIGFKTDDSQNQQEIEVVVNIGPAYYQTTLFKLLVVLFACLIVGTIIHLYIRRKILKFRINKVEFDLLRSQLNPHFIFNTLTSIQYSVLVNTKQVTLKHLSVYAKLMRMCLDYSRIEYITLSEAVDFYNTFVSIESVNLDEAIDFTITVDENIDTEKIEISPMLLQPFIENAIIHGLAPRNKNMKLQLDIHKEQKYLRCVLTDNGIGRAKAAELNNIKKKSHQSVGIELTKKGIVLQLQQEGKKGTHFEIIDNFDGSNNPIGTTVNLKIAYRASKS